MARALGGNQAQHRQKCGRRQQCCAKRTHLRNVCPHFPDRHRTRRLRRVLRIYTLDMAVLTELVEEARVRYVETNRPRVVVHLTDSVL